MNSLKNIIKDLSASLHKEVLGLRQHIHANPELSFEEKKTSAFVSKQLQKLKISHSGGLGGHGIVAILKGKKQGKGVLGLRADMDALPITEENKVSYASNNQGVMHACGHDVHTSSLLGVAAILNKTTHHWSGTVKLVFQPAEEKLPGGASLMIADGLLNTKPKLGSMIGQHVHPELETGKVGFKPGVFMASADEIYISILGEGGHGARPHTTVDPIVVSAHVISQLQVLVSRYNEPTTPSVLTLGKINSIGGATNIIPNEVKIEGTFRTFDEKWRKEAHKRIKKIVENVAKAMGAKAIVDIKVGYPFLYNNPKLTQDCKDYATEFLGKQNVVDLPARMTAEDFAYYSHKLPSCFYRLGTSGLNNTYSSPVHTPTFDVHPESLKVSIGLMSYLAIRYLRS